MIGREPELAAIEAVLGRAPGAPANLVFHGEPGIGKSVLLRTAIASAQAAGIRILGGVGYESEAQLTFAGLHQLFAPVLGYLDDLEPAQRSALRRALGMEEGPAPDRLTLSAATLAALALVAADGPVLIAVEDAHWVDEPTREIMMFVLLRMRPWDLRAVFTRRPLHDRERVLPEINMFQVGPLDAIASGQLLDATVPGLPGPARAQVLRYAAGNPLALVELPSAIGPSAAAGPDMLPAATPVRTRLESVYAARLAGLAEGTRDRLLSVAVDGDALEHGAGGPNVLSAREIAELEEIGLLSVDPMGYHVRYRHPLVRSAIIRDASPEQVRSAHAALAASAAPGSERRLWHLAAATIEADEAVAAEIAQGAERLAVRNDTGSAVMALRRASELSPSADLAAARLQRAARLAVEAGQMDTAERLQAEAGTSPGDPLTVCRAEIIAAQLLLLRDGDLSGAHARLARTLRRYDAELPAEVRDEFVILLSYLAFYSGDELYWAEADMLADRCAASLSEIARLTYDTFSDSTRHGGSLAARLLALTEDLGGDTAPGVVSMLCRIAMRVDALGELRGLVNGLIAGETGGGAVIRGTQGYEFAARDQYLSGQWDACEQTCNEGIELSVQQGFGLPAHRLWCQLGELAASRGDAESARGYISLVEQWARARSSVFHLVMSARSAGVAALAHGDYESAFWQLTRIVPVGSFPAHLPCAQWQVFDVVEAAVHSGNAEQAAAHVSAAMAERIGDVSPRMALLVAGSRAVCADAAGASDSGARYEEALATPGASRWPFDQARIALAFGQSLRRSLQPGLARTPLRQAADLFTGLGASAWLSRAHQELRAAGSVPAPRLRDAQPRDGHGQGTRGPQLAGVGALAQLTAQQREVAELAASGLSNKDIATQLYLSPRTVSAHLYRIFPKLGITSRAGLRDALAALDGDGG